VSVVPTSVCAPQGMTNITRRSATALSTTAAWFPTRSCGTTTCTPLVSRSRGGVSGASSATTRSTHGPAAFTTTCARATTSPPPSRSTTRAPTIRPPSFTKPATSA